MLLLNSPKKRAASKTPGTISAQSIRRGVFCSTEARVMPPPNAITRTSSAASCSNIGRSPSRRKVWIEP